MKKILFVLLIVMIVTPVFADTNISSMSYDDLVELSRAVTAEIMSRPEWKEVEVPSGEWKVGVDIPAGVYSIRPVRSSVNFASYDKNGKLVHNLLCLDGQPIGKVELSDGLTIKISNPVIFAPPISLGF